MQLKNKIIHGVIPSLLIHCSIGSVYAWSLFVNKIASQINISTSKTQFAFSLAIFFLGMSAAFGGRLVEKNVRLSTLISTLFFFTGLIVTGMAIKYKSTIGIFAGYGCLMGIGLGIGYISPVKTLMMWFEKNKGLATGIAVTGFGLASSLASPIITYLTKTYTLSQSFYILAGIYFVPMIIAMFLIKKPYKETEVTTSFRYKKIIKDRFFQKIWLIMFLNISCGLALISTAAPMMESYGLNSIIIATIISIMGIFNSLGRLSFGILTDKMHRRKDIYEVMFSIAIIFSAVSVLFPNSIITIITLFMISMIYGAGFSCLPTVLAEHYSMNNISKIHGLVLTAWGFAGLIGNQLGNYINSFNEDYKMTFTILVIIYNVGFYTTRNLQSKTRR